jgi:hypothetical protein
MNKDTEINEPPTTIVLIVPENNPPQQEEGSPLVNPYLSIYHPTSF